MIIGFTIPGIPQQQGSKVTGRYGGSYDANKNLPAWRADAISCAVREAGGASLVGPVGVSALFIFPRPKSHYGTGRNAAILKPSAPYWHSSKPDSDKLERALGDVLTMARVIRDDAQIARWDVQKIYGERPRVDVIIDLLEIRPTAAPMPIDEVAGLFDYLTTNTGAPV